MEYKYGVCQQCNLTRATNSRGICMDCVFENNHGGQNRQQVYSLRRKEKESIEPVKIYQLKSESVKPRKKVVRGGLIKDERLEKRREQINKDEVTYEEVFNSNPNECEECGRPLPDEFRDENGNVVARFQYSHIMTKSAFPEFRNDPRNFNRLCLKCHHEWEFTDRVEMKIYYKNQETVQILKDEKNKSREE